MSKPTYGEPKPKHPYALDDVYRKLSSEEKKENRKRIPLPLDAQGEMKLTDTRATEVVNQAENCILRWGLRTDINDRISMCDLIATVAYEAGLERSDACRGE